MYVFNKDNVHCNQITMHNIQGIYVMCYVEEKKFNDTICLYIINLDEVKKKILNTLMDQSMQ